MHRLRISAAPFIAVFAALAALLGPGVMGASVTPAAFADEEVGTGTHLASGSKITTSIYSLYTSIEDRDLYVFDGFAGQTVTVTITVPGSSKLIPFLEVFRPDGTPVLASQGKFTPKPVPSLTRPKLVKFIYKLNQTGVWTLRLRGGFPGKKVFDDPDTTEVDEGDDPKTEKKETSHLEYDYGVDGAKRTKGEYTILITYTKAPKAEKRNAAPGPDGLYRFLVPAAGGSKLTGVLTYSGGMPLFEKVIDPAGKDLLVVTSKARKTPGKNIVTLSGVVLPASSPPGPYTVTFRAPVSPAATKVMFSASTTPVKVEKALKLRFANSEPSIESLDRTEGGPGVAVTVTCLGITDPSKRTGKPRVFLDRIEMKVDQVNVIGLFSYIKFTTPTSSLDFPDGAYDLRVTSSSGQTATRRNAFTVVPPPIIDSIDPTSASEAGNFIVTIKGSNFSTASNTAMRIRYRGVHTTLDVTTAIPMIPPLSSTQIRYLHPLKGQGLDLGQGEFYVEVENYATGRRGTARQTLTLDKAATINRVTPGLIPILGGETIYVSGANFVDTDHVYLEKTPNSPGVVPDDFDDITAQVATFQNGNLHQFVAPPKPKGTYRVFVRDTINTYDTPMRTFSYYQLADFTPNLGLDGADGYDAHSTALGDYNPLDPKAASPADRPDLFLARRGGATKSATSLTRVFRNDGDGSFTDVTSSVMPAVTSDDDWRADKIVVSDIDLDGYPDLVLATDAADFPTKLAKSHVRILINQPRGSGAPASDRVFRDATADLMPPVRKFSSPQWGSPKTNEIDDWRALDMFVGDIDFSNKAPPEIVITTERVFENNYVTCAPYCSSIYNLGYPYSFYFSGTRVFKWDQSARSGLGRYKYDSTYFPRKSGVVIPIFNPPPGITVPSCQPNECRGKFTPFIGQRLAVADINFDPSRPETAKPDIAVLNNQTVTRDSKTISSLQVALNQASTTEGTSVTDVTLELEGVDGTGTFLKGDALSIGHPGYEGMDVGVIAIAKASGAGLTTSALRFIRYKKPADPKDPADFDDITTAILPATTPTDRFQSSQIRFIDVDGDGDEDLVTVASGAPVGSEPAFRIFRNDIAASPKLMTYTLALRGLIVGVPDEIPSLPLDANGHYAGESLVIGDLNGDGAMEYLITRSGTGTGPNTRAIKTDK